MQHLGNLGKRKGFRTIVPWLESLVALVPTNSKLADRSDVCDVALQLELFVLHH